MGVNGLTKLIKSENRFVIKNYQLHSVKIVIDANSLSTALRDKVGYPSGSDVVGVNLVDYGKQVELFIDNLRKCKVEPILVFDGTQTEDAVTPPTSEEVEPTEEAFDILGKLYKWTSCGSHPVAHPVRTTMMMMILKSIAIERQVQVKQCFYEGEKFVAKIANDCDSPVLSGHSDFFIFNIKRGVIPMDSLKFEDIKEQINDEQSGEETQPIFYIECDLFDQNHFVNAFPGLDKSCLPLFASVAGNDISGEKLDFLLLLVPRNYATANYGRLILLIEFLCNKTLEQCIKSLIALVEANRREDIEALIMDSIRYYDLPEEDDFDREISKLYKEAFCKTYSSKFDHDPVFVDLVAEKQMRSLSQWLRKRMETSNLTKTCLELAPRNVSFLRPEMDDFAQQPNAHNYFKRYLSIQLALMRSSRTQNLSRSFIDREGDSIDRFEVKPLLELENYGPMDNLIYDVCEDLPDDIVTTKLTQSDKTAILLAIFHSSSREFLDSVAQYEEFLKPQYAEEFVVIKLLMRYVELEEDITFPPRFQKSVLVTYLYYLHYGDAQVKTHVADDADESYLRFLDRMKELVNVDSPESLDHQTMTDYDLMHNIVQTQNAIRAYEELNAFLGTSLPTVQMHKWFNSSFIYNFIGKVEQLHVYLVI